MSAGKMSQSEKFEYEMKPICIIVVLIAAASTVTSESAKERKEKLEKITEECRKGIAVVEDLKSDLINCVGACYLEKLGVMDKANRLVPDKVDMLLNPAVKSKNGKLFKDVSKEITGKCISATDKDKCQSAAKIVSCLYEEATKMGFSEDLLS